VVAERGTPAAAEPRDRGAPVLVINPIAGRGHGARLAPLCRQLGVRYHVASSPAQVEALARAAVDDGAARLIVAGGDGTVRLALAVLAGTPTALGIVPSGAGNDLARALGLDRAPGPALERAVSGATRRIDLGAIAGRSFGCVAALGLDGDVLRFLRERPRLPRRPWIYAYAVLRCVAAFAPPRVTVEFDGGSFADRVTLLAVANAPQFGGGMRVAPAADLGDGLLDLIVVGAIPRAKLLALFPRIYRGTHVGHPAVRHLRVRSATVETDRPLVVHGDGEPLAETGPGRPVRIEACPQALWIAA
jgi:diacylglycerol kinase (ATP)